MNTCESCGNAYDKSFTMTVAGRTYTFDCFECAIHQLAPRCGNCSCRVLGHGIEARGEVFCCAHCSKSKGVQGAVDRIA